MEIVMKLVKVSGILIISTLLIGCAINTASYTPPSDKGGAKNNFTINKGYDETYSALVGVLAGTFFAIDNFDKGSGLITLSYSATGDVSKYIDCGNWESTNSLDPQRFTFKGKYESYLVKAWNAKLMGRLNIVVKSVGKNKTQLIVNSRYTFDDFTFTGVDDARISARNSGTDDPTRICRPTGYVERMIADQIINL